MTRLPTPRRLTQLQGWDAAVATSAAILVLVLVAFGIGWLASRESRATTIAVATPVTAVDLDLASGDADIVGGGTGTVELRRSDHFAFDRSATEQRSLADGVLHVSSRCPRIVVGSCSSSYRVVVPDGVAVTVHTRGGEVHLAGFRGNARIFTRAGSVTVDAFCGFDLAARTGSGNVRVTAACAPKSVELSSTSGDIAALVPPGRYRVRASSGSGHARVSGVTPSADAPFTIGVASGSGDVSIGGGL